jgi:hypothetical protein
LLRGVGLAPLTIWIALCAVRAESSGFDDMNPSLSLRFDSEFALQTRDGSGQKFDNNGFAELLLDPPSNLQLVWRFRIQSEALDELDPGGFSATGYARGAKPGTPGNVWEIEHREIYLQWTLRAAARAWRQAAVGLGRSQGPPGTRLA